MGVTRAQIEARLAALRAGLAELRDKFAATEGAIEDCQHWLSVLDEQEKPEEPKA